MKAMQSEREGDSLHPLVCVVTERVPGWNNVLRNQFFTMHIGLLTYVRVSAYETFGLLYLFTTGLLYVPASAYETFPSITHAFRTYGPHSRT